MYKKILVGIDGSEPSNKALKEAATFGEAMGAELVVFHAVAHHYQIPVAPYTLLMPQVNLLQSQQSIDQAALQRMYEEAGKAIIANGKKFLENLKLGIEGRVKYQLELEVSPEDFAIDYAKKNNIDLIIVGCKGHHSRARRVLMGTVAMKIVNEAPCQVLVVR